MICILAHLHCTSEGHWILIVCLVLNYKWKIIFLQKCRGIMPFMSCFWGIWSSADPRSFVCEMFSVWKFVVFPLFWSFSVRPPLCGSVFIDLRLLLWSSVGPSLWALVCFRSRKFSETVLLMIPLPHPRCFLCPLFLELLFRHWPFWPGVLFLIFLPVLQFWLFALFSGDFLKFIFQPFYFLIF